MDDAAIKKASKKEKKLSKSKKGTETPAELEQEKAEITEQLE